ncbi:MAG: helix-turn-helix domain-containing protein [Eubacteriales bacterium]
MPQFFSVPPVNGIQTLTIKERYIKEDNDVYFFLVLSGEIKISLNKSEYFLGLGDVIMIDPRHHFLANGYDKNLTLVIKMRSDFFYQGKSEFFGTFICNSSQDSSRDYTAIRKILSQIALTYYENQDVNQIRQFELCYSLLYYLNLNHYEDNLNIRQDNKNKFRQREYQIISYLGNNYMNSITLQDLSDVVFLSPTYLSRFFKKQFGQNFNEYLNQIRLEHAINDITFTTMPITTIAFNNGFSSNNALNILFKKKYNRTPSEYRKIHSKDIQEKKPQDSILVDKLDFSIVEQKLSTYAENQADDTSNHPIKVKYEINNSTDREKIVPIWKSIINIGDSSNFRNFNTQSQLVMAQKEIGFQYSRIQGVLNEELIPPLDDNSYNFSNFDSIIELLTSLNLTPFLDLTFKQNYLFMNGFQLVYPPYYNESQKDHAGYFLEKVSALIKHSINTFGISAVEKWVFEIGYEHDEYLSVTEEIPYFVNRFKKAYALIKSFASNALVGGMSHNLTVDSPTFKEIIVNMDKADFSPDFISLCGFPYESFDSTNNNKKFVISSDPSFIVKKVDEAKSILAKYPRITQSLYLTVFGPDIKIRNHVNDSCYQSSFIVKNIIDLLGKVEAMGYWQLSDIGTEYKDTSRILFGGNGLITKNGIKKPGFIALKRLNIVNSEIVHKESGCLLSTNGVNTYSIILCNYAHFNDFYCVSEATSSTLKDVYSVFKDDKNIDVSIILNDIQKGRYKIITTTLNQENGCLLDKWIQYGILDDLQPRDIRYLSDSVHPQRTARYMTCGEGTLNLSFQLMPHEVKFIELIREL